MPPPQTASHLRSCPRGMCSLQRWHPCRPSLSFATCTNASTANSLTPSFLSSRHVLTAAMASLSPFSVICDLHQCLHRKQPHTFVPVLEACAHCSDGILVALLCHLRPAPMPPPQTASHLRSCPRGMCSLQRWHP